MTELSAFFHYITIALMVAFNAFSVGIGQGLTTKAALTASDQQPAAHSFIVRAAMIGMALIETVAILAIFMATLLLLMNKSNTNIFLDIANMGIALSICLAGTTLGIVSAFPAQAACFSIARQPFLHQRIIGFMIMTQALIQTPIIAALIVSIFIRNQSLLVHTWNDSLRLVGAGLAIGLGSVGPAIGLALFARTACQTIGFNRTIYNKLLTFTLISQAIIETPIIFVLVISIALLFISPAPNAHILLPGIIYIAAAICAAVGTFGVGISSGRTAATACFHIAQQPDNYSLLSRASMLAQGLIETSAIYAILISLILIFYGS